MNASEPSRHVGRPERSDGQQAVPEQPRDWRIYRGTGVHREGFAIEDALPAPPPWRTFRGGPLQPVPPDDEEQLERRLGTPIESLGVDETEVDAVNAALYLRRPLLVLGSPGVGKSSIAYKISRELGLGRVLRWPISSRSTLRSGLHEYDAIGRAQDAAWQTRTPPPPDADEARPMSPASSQAASIGDYIQLGPLGTALLPYAAPRVLLIDELDKGDEDLPNDLLDVFEEGAFVIPELKRLSALAGQITVHTDDAEGTAVITRGRIECRAFPMIVITSNGERELPPAFLRRCLRFQLSPPSPERLADMIAGHLGRWDSEEARKLLTRFLEQRVVRPELSGDQLLNAVYLTTSGRLPADDSVDRVLELLWRELTMARKVP